MASASGGRGKSIELTSCGMYVNVKSPVNVASSVPPEGCITIFISSRGMLAGGGTGIGLADRNEAEANTTSWVSVNVFILASSQELLAPIILYNRPGAQFNLKRIFLKFFLRSGASGLTAKGYVV